MSSDPVGFAPESVNEIITASHRTLKAIGSILIPTFLEGRPLMIPKLARRKQCRFRWQFAGRSEFFEFGGEPMRFVLSFLNLLDDLNDLRLGLRQRDAKTLDRFERGQN